MQKIDYSHIKELKNLWQEKEKIEDWKEKLSQNVLTDLTLIPRLYEWYQELPPELVWRTGVYYRKFRKQFIFVTLYLFSPKTFVGKRTVKGVRKILADLLGLSSPSAVSNTTKDMTDLYTYSREFRREVNIIYTLLIERLKQEGLLSETVNDSNALQEVAHRHQKE